MWLRGFICDFVVGCEEINVVSLCLRCSYGPGIFLLWSLAILCVRASAHIYVCVFACVRENGLNFFIFYFFVQHMAEHIAPMILTHVQRNFH